MAYFTNMTFGHEELKILKAALEDWRKEQGLEAGAPEVELAAAIFINLFKEGNITELALKAAARRHKGLSEMNQPHPPRKRKAS